MRLPMLQNTDHGGSVAAGSPPQIGAPPCQSAGRAPTLVRQIGEQPQPRPSAMRPRGAQQRAAARVACGSNRDAGEQRHDLVAAHGQQIAHQSRGAGARARCALVPVEHGGRGTCARRADRGSRRRAAHRRSSNSARRPLRTASASAPLKVAEERERLRAPHSSPMNISGGIGASSMTASAASHGGRIGKRVEALAERAVADLVVVLQEIDEGGGRQARRSARRAGVPPRCAERSP